MSTVETKPVRLNWIHVDDDLSYADVVLARMLVSGGDVCVLRIFCERVQTGWLCNADISALGGEAEVATLMECDKGSAILALEDSIRDYLAKYGLKIVECA